MLTIDKVTTTIDKIDFIQTNIFEFQVIAEWCGYPLKIYKNRLDAEDYVKGFKQERIREQTDAYLEGLRYRKFVEQDVRNGWEFKRYCKII